MEASQAFDPGSSPGWRIKIFNKKYINKITLVIKTYLNTEFLIFKNKIILF